MITIMLLGLYLDTRHRLCLTIVHFYIGLIDIMIGKRLFLCYRTENENLIRIEKKGIRLNFIDDHKRKSKRSYIGNVILDPS
jgi:hypothetical protein